MTHLEEPPIARGALAPGLLAGVVLVFVHAAASTLVGGVSAAASPGPGTAGGLWDVVAWLVAVAVAAASVRPVLRRTARPLLTALVAAAVGCLGYAVVAGVLAGGAPMLGWRLGTLAAVVVVLGLVTPSGPPTDPEASGDGAS